MENQEFITLSNIFAELNEAIVCNYDIFGEDKDLNAPIGAIGIKNANDLKELAIRERSREINLDHIGIVYWPCYLSKFIMSKVITDRIVQNFLNDRLRFIVPEVEWLYYKNKALQERIQRLLRRNNVESFYEWTFDKNSFNRVDNKTFTIFNNWITEKINNRADPEFRSFIGYIFGVLNIQESYGSSILFPPVPLISDYLGLEIGLEFWRWSNRIYIAGNSDYSGLTRPIGLVLTLGKKFFSQPNVSFNNCLDKLEEELPQLKPELIHIRYLKDQDSNYTMSEASNFRLFIDVIVEYGRNNNKPTGVIDNSCFSRLALVKGTNIAGIRLDGKVQSPSGGTNTPLEKWKVWSQANQEMIAFEDFVANGRNIPHLPATSRIMHDSLTLPVSIPTLTKTKHLSIAEGLYRDVSEIRQAIIEGSLRTYENRVLETSISTPAQHFLRI